MPDNPQTTNPVNLSSARRRYAEVFAPWVQQLNLSIEAVTEDSVVLRLPYADELCRIDRLVCGQAMMTLIDTCMVFVCYAAQGRFCNCTTVSQNTSFMRPARGQDILATGRALKSGRSLVFGEVTLRTADDGRTVCSGTSTYMVLPD